ncbi:hypothetical protein Ae201684P_014645 [Aphanomyces euteiches]|uniref:Uncharacterized protein n=1 Tax=Aphanomyces euteiches TaxID=100861 RepID=A0A6G0WXI0_9STRA|nr:hypothetical protein Ae201684_010537 [Aphanomyces euteiches]KAH9089890.1 hypothetical protein Ae201684P_014645 [Aphanomyces euteiches]
MTSLGDSGSQGTVMSVATRMRDVTLFMVTVNVVLPLVLYSILAKRMAAVYAILLSSIPPSINTIVGIVRERRCDVFSALSVMSIGVSAVVTFVTRDARLLLAKDSFFTVGLGLSYWFSTIYADEDIMWSYYRLLHDPDAQKELDLKYNRPDVRSRWHFVCRVWGSAFLLEAVIRILLIYSIPVHTMVYVNTLLFVGMMCSLGGWSKWYIARSSHREVAAERLLDEPNQYENARISEIVSI